MLPAKFPVNGKSLQFRLDSILFYDWPPSLQQWTYEQKNQYFYDQRLNDTLQVIMLWDGNNQLWKNHAQYQKYFDHLNLLSTRVHSVWSVTHLEWTSTTRFIYFYDARNRIESYLVQNRDSVSSAWQNVYKYSYGYDNDGHWIFYLRQTWDQDHSVWLYDYQFLYTYTYGLKTKMVRQDWDPSNTVWVNRSQSTYRYNEDHTLGEEMGMVWNGDLAAWDSNSLISYIRHPDGQVIEKTYMAWSPSGWYYTANYGYEYNSQGWNTRITYYTAIGGDTVWENRVRYDYGYSDHGQLILETGLLWNTSRGDWDPDYKIEYYRSSIDVSLQSVPEETGFTIYPNPAAGSLHIVLREEPLPGTVLKIYESTGRIVLRKAVESHYILIDDLHLQSGIYNLCIENQDQRVCKKLLILE